MKSQKAKEFLLEITDDCPPKQTNYVTARQLIQYEIRIGNITIERFDNLKEAHKYAKNEIKECGYEGFVDIYVLTEELVESIKK